MKRFDIDEPNRIAQILQILKDEEPSTLSRMVGKYPSIFSEPTAPAGKVDESLISAKRRQMGNMFRGGRRD